MWRLKQFKNGKYGLWTTISDGYLHEPRQLSREQMIEFIKDCYKRDYKKECRKVELTFPNDFIDKDTRAYITDNRYMSLEKFFKQELDLSTKAEGEGK